MSKGQCKRLVDTAARTNARRSADERKGGWGTPESGPDDGLLRTAMCAIHCGLETDDLAAVAEGLDMLRTLHTRMTGKLYSPWDHAA